MPQMAPISWLILFFMFSFTFIIFNMTNYYCFSLQNKKNFSNTETFKKKELNWKW